MITLKPKYCRYDGVNKLDGIVNYFRNQTKTLDANQKGLISLKASGNEDILSSILTYDTSASGFWYTQGIKSWIEINFGDNFVAINGYTLRSYGRDVLKKWEVNGSMDGSNWDLIDSKTIDAMPEDVLDNRYYTTDRVIKSKMIRFYNTDNRFDSFNTNYFYLHRLELFGHFYSCFSFYQKTCNRKRILLFNVFTYTIVLSSK